MRRLLPLIVIGILVLSGLGAVAVHEIDSKEQIEITETILFSPPTLQGIGQYVIVTIPETDRTLKISGRPEMPMVPYPLDLPFGVKNIEINVILSSEHVQGLKEKIRPTPQTVTPIYNGESTISTLIEDPNVYESEDRYPASCYDVKITCGLNVNNQRVTHISLYFYPVQYSPALNKIYYIDEATVKITYDAPEEDMMYFEDEYDLIIIAPEEFSEQLQPLVDHKNANNIVTFLKTTESIYNEFSGFDKPEQIKRFIQYAIETYNVRNILLVGGLKYYYNAQDRDDCNQGSIAWYLPVRYTNIQKIGLHDPGALCDLYFADVYRYNESAGEYEFEDWNSHHDGIIGHWNKFPGVPADVLDLNPDVHVGRLPCRKKFEVRIVVWKIIEYEKTSPSSKPWMKKMIGITGLNHDFYEEQPDGEYLCDLAFDYMDDLIDEEVRVYASNNETGGPIPVPKDIAQAFTQGAGYIYMSGHGHPIRWDTHPIDNINRWIGGIHLRNMWRFFNFKKLPIVMVTGCHNGQYNITWYRTRHSPDFGDDRWYWTHGDPGTVCFNWGLIRMPWGGAIASIGATGLTSSVVGQPNTGNSELATNFFYQIGKNGATTMGQAYSGAIQKFLDENTVELWEAHCITIYQLFGDPSLQFGGIS